MEHRSCVLMAIPQRHLQLSRWDRQEPCKTPCNDWKTRIRNAVRSPWQRSKVSKAPWTWLSNAHIHSMNAVISQLRLHRDLKGVLWDVTVSISRAHCGSMAFKNAVFAAFIQRPKELLLRKLRSLDVSSAFISIYTALPRRF